MNGKKYIATARLGEGVIYTNSQNEWWAGIIIAQRDEETVNLLVFHPTLGTTRVEINVPFDPMANTVGSWSSRPKT